MNLSPITHLMLRPISCTWLFLSLTVFPAWTMPSLLAQTYDLVILNGRVMDPESGLDAVRHVGVTGPQVKAISPTPLTGRITIDAKGLVVAPGFIDLHQHAQDQESYRFKVRDGVTTALELEVGTADIDRWYAEREGKLPINFGASIGHIQVRMQVLGDPPSFLPSADSRAATQAATEETLEALKAGIERGLKRGAPAVGFGLQYTPAATRWEVLEMFRIASRYRAPCHVHIRYKGEKEPGSSIEALEELIAASVITGAPLHIVHINSSGGSVTQKLLQIISEAQSQGVDVTVECYPYTAGMTEITSAIFDPGWRQKMGMDYRDLQWGDTGERLTAETFAKYRRIGGLVIAHSNPESIVRGAVVHPLTIIASDGLKGHPRNAGTYARILGRYVRETKGLTLMDALRKITLMPAQRLEERVSMMKGKGRIRVGADADLTIFDPDRVIDKATFTDAAQYSEGIEFVLVNGIVVVENGELRQDVRPGRAVRAPLSSP